MRPVPRLSGQRFGRWLVIEQAEPLVTARHRKHRWLCRCDCGVERVIKGSMLMDGTSESCGCGRLARSMLSPRKHGHSKAHRDGRRTYNSWAMMIQRCTNPKNPAYDHYGGRGISVCDRWRLDFKAFLADMGERPHRTSIDRIDVDGHYEPGNCRWATDKEQRRNTSRTVIEPHEAAQIRWLSGLGHGHGEIANLLGTSKNAVWHVVTNRTWKDAST